MKIIIDENKVKKYRKIGQYFLWATFGLLIIGMALTFNQDIINQYVGYYFAALFLALLSSQIGMYLTNRYGGNPRQDEVLNAALKGIDDRHSLYHFNAGVSHLLVGPSGVHVVIPYFQGGTITYDEKKGRWKQSGVNSFMKILGRDNLGRPDMDARDNINDATKFLSKKIEGELPLAVKAVLVFTNPKASIQAQNAPIPTMAADKLKDYIRRQIKEEKISDTVLDQIKTVLPDFETE
jgi:hypothetical protein